MAEDKKVADKTLPTDSKEKKSTTTPKVEDKKKTTKKTPKKPETVEQEKPTDPIKVKSNPEKTANDTTTESGFSVFMTTVTTKSKSAINTAKQKVNDFREQQATKKSEASQNQAATEISASAPEKNKTSLSKATMPAANETSTPTSTKEQTNTAAKKPSTPVDATGKTPIAVIHANYILYGIRIVILAVIFYIINIKFLFIPTSYLDTINEKATKYFEYGMLVYNLVAFILILIIISQIVAMFNKITIYKDSVQIKKYVFWERQFHLKEIQDIRWIKRIYYLGFVFPARSYYEVVLIHEDKHNHLSGMRYSHLKTKISKLDDEWLNYKMNRALGRIADNKQLNFADTLKLSEHGIRCVDKLVLWQDIQSVTVEKSEVIMRQKNGEISYRNFIEEVRDVSLLILLAEYFLA